MNKEPCYICWIIPRKNFKKCNECTSTLCNKCYQKLKRDDSLYYYKCPSGHDINKKSFEHEIKPFEHNFISSCYVFITALTISLFFSLCCYIITIPFDIRSTKIQRNDVYTFISRVVCEEIKLIRKNNIRSVYHYEVFDIFHNNIALTKDDDILIYYMSNSTCYLHINLYKK